MKIAIVPTVIVIKVILLNKWVVVMLSSQAHHLAHLPHRVRVTLMLNIAKRVILLVNIV
jgi:hypothetical protein